MPELQIRPYNDSKKPHLRFIVRIPEEAQKVAGTTRRFFEEKAAARTFVGWLHEQCALHKSGRTTLTEHRIVEADRCFRALEEAGFAAESDLYEAVKFFIDRRRRSTDAKTFDQLCTEYLAHLKALGRSEGHVKTSRKRLVRARKEFGSMDVRDIDTPSLSSWLKTLAPDENKPDVAGLSAATRNGIQLVLGSTLEYARRELKLITTNPISDVQQAQVKYGAVSVFSAEEFRRLLRAAIQMKEEELLLWLLIGGLAGLRPVEVESLRWSNIHLDEKEPVIEVDADDPRSYAHRFVAIQPVLAEWLRDYAGRTGMVSGLTETELRKRRYRAMHMAGIETWKQDALRHSFASYRLAASGDVRNVMVDMGHASPKMIEKHYRLRIRSKDAAPWWETTRAVVLATDLPPTPEFPVISNRHQANYRANLADKIGGAEE